MKRSENLPVISTRYPYVVVRPMAGVYIKKPVVFSKEEPTRLKLSEPAFLIQYPSDAFTRKGLLKKSATEALFQAVEKQMDQWKFRCCVVLAKDRCVYLEFGITRNPSIEPPSGGVQLDHLITPVDQEPPQPRKLNDDELEELLPHYDSVTKKPKIN